jgi:hypothetical protein
MNGCCMTHAECPCHDASCYFHWPCGCRKERNKPGAKAKPHTHRYEEKIKAEDSSTAHFVDDDDDDYEIPHPRDLESPHGGDE